MYYYYDVLVKVDHAILNFGFKDFHICFKFQDILFEDFRTYAVVSRLS